MRFCLPILLLASPTAVHAADAFHFENDILPILSRYGCNSSGCHGKAEGQGGFKLSVFASDPEADHAALTKEARGRRVFPASAEESLMLRKGTGRTAHGGGTRIPFGGEDYRVLRDWVAAGTPVGSPDAPRVVSLRVEPVERVMGQKADQQLKVFAKYSDGVEKDVTRHARFQSNTEAVAAVSPGGMVSTRDVPGEAAVMAAYLGETVDTLREGLRPVSARGGQGEPPAHRTEATATPSIVETVAPTVHADAPPPERDDLLRRARAFADVVGLSDCVQPAPMSSAGFRLAPIPYPGAAPPARQRAWGLLAGVSGQVDREALASVSLDQTFLLWLVDPADASATAFWEVLACLRRTHRPTGGPDTGGNPAHTREEA